MFRPILKPFEKARTQRRVDALRADPHLARDIGVLPLPEKPRSQKWRAQW